MSPTPTEAVEAAREIIGMDERDVLHSYSTRKAAIVARALLTACEALEVQKITKTPSMLEQFLVRHAKANLSTIAYAEANADDWAGALPAADRDRLRSDAQMFQYAADIIATLVRDLEAARAALSCPAPPSSSGGSGVTKL